MITLLVCWVLCSVFSVYVIVKQNRKETEKRSKERVNMMWINAVLKTKGGKRNGKPNV